MVNYMNEENENVKGYNTLVINAYGGPGAGKSTAALDIVSALKKKDIIAEYVPEYAKELLWQGRTDLLDGSSEHQHMILEEQYRRQEQLKGKCQIIVTDSPLLLNISYNKQLTADYEKEVLERYDEFQNFAFIVQRDEKKYEQEGRLQDLDQAKHIDKLVMDLLDKNKVGYGIYNHENIGKVVYNASKVYYGINKSKTDLPKNVKKISQAITKKKEEYIAVQKDKLNEVNHEIKKLAISYVTKPEQIAELLKFGAQFYNYSARNVMLIMSQNSGATYVQSFEKWKEAGYHVNKGQRGLKVLVPVTTTYIKVPGEKDEYIKLSLAPKKLKELYKQHKVESIKKNYYTVGNVFDISQTNCPTEKYPEFYNMGYRNTDHDKLIEGIENYATKELEIPVFTNDINSISIRGYYLPSVKTITINHLLNSTEHLSTLTHELGHAVMDHSTYASAEDKYRKEFEADCFSIMLDNHLGIPITNSRQSHLAQNYRNMENDYLSKDKNFEFDEIIGDVFKHFSAVVNVMDNYIDDKLEKGKNIEAVQPGTQEVQTTNGKSNLLNNMLKKQYSVDQENEIEMA